MNREVLVDEEISALVRVRGDGSVEPTSFIWRGKTRYVADVGRQWEERAAGRSLHCYLVQTVDLNTYELRWDAGEDRWRVYRAWLRDLLV